ncbi:MAG: hypothetical protein LCH99_04465 [Proteobacteria bacterium]|nr:hypothetical protein [Pseudomonadota bacterium]
MDTIKQGDQIRLLEALAREADTGEFTPMFTYPNCGWDLVQSGFCTQDRKITTAGRAALFLLGKGEDPTTGGSSISFSIPISETGPDGGAR